MFGSGDAFYQHKNPTPVRVEMASEAPVEGFVFLATGDRLSDLLNDPRPFIPVRRTDGATVIVAKNHIISIVERIAKPQELVALPQGDPQEARGSNNPYCLLQVAPDAPMADIIASCRRLTQTLLPKHKVGVDVQDPQIKTALSAAKKILNAYKMILRERGLDSDGRDLVASPDLSLNKSA